MWVCAKWLQSSLTLCDPMGCNPPDSSVHGILQEEYWSGLPFPPPGIFPAQGSKQHLLHLLHWYPLGSPCENTAGRQLSAIGSGSSPDTKSASASSEDFSDFRTEKSTFVVEATQSMILLLLHPKRTKTTVTTGEGSQLRLREVEARRITGEQQTVQGVMSFCA